MTQLQLRPPSSSSSSSSSSWSKGCSNSCCRTQDAYRKNSRSWRPHLGCSRTCSNMTNRIRSLSFPARWIQHRRRDKQWVLVLNGTRCVQSRPSQAWSRLCSRAAVARKITTATPAAAIHPTMASGTRADKSPTHSGKQVPSALVPERGQGITFKTVPTEAPANSSVT